MKSKMPMRQCAGCRQMKSKKEMIRVLRTTEGAIELDATGKKNGRGAYLCYDADCLGRARKSRALERSLKISIAPEIYEELEKELNAVGER